MTKLETQKNNTSKKKQKNIWMKN